MDLNTEEFLKNVIKADIVRYAAKDSSGYVFNDDKCEKMNDIIAYCQKLEQDYGCKIIRCMVDPKQEHGYVQVLFQGEFAVGGEDGSLEEFISTMKMCDGVNITTNPASDEMFQITFFVENLWIRKDKLC